jgi:hypothetical protein
MPRRCSTCGAARGHKKPRQWGPCRTRRAGRIGQGPGEPIGYIIDGPDYHEGWLREPYRDDGTHPRTLGELLWSQLDPWPAAKHDDIPDALADAYASRAVSGTRGEKARARARGYVR